jgi:hypothetical protein
VKSGGRRRDTLFSEGSDGNRDRVKGTWRQRRKAGEGAKQLNRRLLLRDQSLGVGRSVRTPMRSATVRGRVARSFHIYMH